MAAIVQAIIAFVTYVIAFIAQRWGFKLALVAGVVGTYTVCYATFVAAFAFLSGLIPPSALSSFTLQFFPSASAIATACTAFWGSMAVRKACEYWVKVWANASKVAA